MSEEMEKLARAIVEADYEAAATLTQQALDKRIDVMEIVQDGVAKGGEMIGALFERNEVHLPELLLATDVMKSVMEVVRPHIQQSTLDAQVPVVIGTIQGDIHDIGKGILAMMLNAAGFNVIDLGADVPIDKFVTTAKESNAKIVAMSALITTTMMNMEGVIKGLEKEHIRDQTVVIVGGAPLGTDFADRIGADHYGKDAAEGVVISKESTL